MKLGAATATPLMTAMRTAPATRNATGRLFGAVFGFRTIAVSGTR
jgi:hypothetical protein